MCSISLLYYICTNVILQNSLCRRSLPWSRHHLYSQELRVPVIHPSNLQSSLHHLLSYRPLQLHHRLSHRPLHLQTRLKQWALLRWQCRVSLSKAVLPQPLLSSVPSTPPLLSLLSLHHPRSISQQRRSVVVEQRRRVAVKAVKEQRRRVAVKAVKPRQRVIVRPRQADVTRRHQSAGEQQHQRVVARQQQKVVAKHSQRPQVIVKQRQRAAVRHLAAPGWTQNLCSASMQ